MNNGTAIGYVLCDHEQLFTLNTLQYHNGLNKLIIKYFSIEHDQ